MNNETRPNEKKEKSTVLVIDDEVGLRNMLKFGLSNRGFQVLLAANGDEALEQAQHEPIDLVVCDIMMPGKSGVQVLKELKTIQPTAEVVMATGYATLETAVESMKQGAYDYIAKPYALNQLCVIFEKALEHRRLKTKVGELEELNRLKSEFLATMSHELRTPMSAIMGFTTLMLQGVGGPITNDQKEYLNRIESNSKNLLQLINDILDLSKLSAGRMPVFRERCNLQEIVQEVVETMESLAQKRQLTLTSEIPQALYLRTDKTKLKQVLINLVGNALKFTHQGGVSVKMDTLPELSQIRIYVQDTGIGIKPEDMSLLFQEFRQLDSSTTREYGGTGLGLSISKKILEVLGGTIQAKSTQGVGSTFTVTLPLESVPMPEILEPSKNLERTSPNQKMVLAIDDDPDMLRLIAESLKGSEYTVVGAQSGQEGLALARQIHPYAITLDIMMPHMDGWSVLQTLKSEPNLQSIPVFIVSIVDNKALGFSLGASDYIMKPFDRQTLLEKLALCDKVHQVAA